MDKGTHEPIGAAMTTKKISRRQVARGAAWAVPTVAVGAATPAWAASPCEINPGDYPKTLGPGTHTVLLPAKCAEITFELAAGAGGEPTGGPSAGQGATVKGSFVRQDIAQDLQITFQVGFGGAIGESFEDVKGGEGYGNGGHAGDATMAGQGPSGNNYTAGKIAAGGGGSALLVPGPGPGGLVPIVVVGGGGGGKKGWASANSDGSCNESAVWNYRTIGISGNGAVGPTGPTDGVSSEDWICVNKAAADAKDFVVYLDLYAGQGGVGATGGLGGVIDKTGAAVTLPPEGVGPSERINKPDPQGIIKFVATYGVYDKKGFTHNGGNNGTGANGGGDGGHGALPWGGAEAASVVEPGDVGRCVGGPGGGGGYAGGGGGSVWATAYVSKQTGCNRRETYSSGAGGGSSYYADGAVPGYTIEGLEWGLNGVTPPVSAGKDGYLTYSIIETA